LPDNSDIIPGIGLRAERSVPISVSSSICRYEKSKTIGWIVFDEPGSSSVYVIELVNKGLALVNII